MSKVFLISVACLGLVLSVDPLLEEHLGWNYPVAEFSNGTASPTCSPVKLSAQDDIWCDCPQSSFISSIFRGALWFFPVITYDKYNYTSLSTDLNQECYCNHFGVSQPLVMVHLDDNYGILYRDRTDSKGNYFGTLLAKNLTTLAQLQSYVAGVPELADREKQIICTL